MNREVFQRSSSVKQIMGGSPCWWSSTTTTSINSSRPSLDQNPNSIFSSSSSSSPPSLSSSSLSHYSPLPSSFLPSLSPSQVNHPLPLSWSQLLLGGVQVGEEERYSMYLLDDNQIAVDVKRVQKSYGDGGYDDQEIIHGANCCSSWSQVLQPVSSPNSCLTTSFSSNIPDFSKRSVSSQPDHSSECNYSRTSSAALKKAKIQLPSSTDQSSLKVVIRKEKLGDRVAALHQLVSPFGKTDTASVLQEAIGYIRFLHSQIEALSSPYLATASVRSHSLAQGERNCIIVEEDGDEGIDDDEPRDLKSRGLCLVPVSITLHVDNENGADYWSRSCTGDVR